MVEPPKEGNDILKHVEDVTKSSDRGESAKEQPEEGDFVLFMYNFILYTVCLVKFYTYGFKYL